jgi:hypothetical protein
MELASNALDQFLFGEPAFSGPTFAKSINESQHLIKERISQGGGGSSLVQRFKTDAAMLTFRKGPDRWQLGAKLDLFLEGRRGIRRGDPAGNFASPSRKRVLDPVQEELLRGFEDGTISVRIARHELRQDESFEGGVDLRRTDRQLKTHLSHRRTPSFIAQELHENEDVLGSQAGLWHSIFAIRESRITPLGTGWLAINPQNLQSSLGPCDRDEDDQGAASSASIHDGIRARITIVKSTGRLGFDRDRDTGPRDVFLHDFDLPRGLGREAIFDRRQSWIFVGQHGDLAQ